MVSWLPVIHMMKAYISKFLLGAQAICIEMHMKVDSLAL